MPNEEQYAENDPRHHTTKIKNMLSNTINHLREDVSKVSEPKAQALFETTAGVLNGLKTVYEDYFGESDQAWQK